MDCPEDGEKAAHDHRVVDDKMAEARERIKRIETSADAKGPAQDVEPISESGLTDQQTSEREFEKSLKELESESRDLKSRIAEERTRHDMPIDSALGDPEIEKANADGRNDLPDRDQD